jgi:hypothetical protein
VFLRRFGPLKAMRIQLLDELAATDRPPEVEDICYAIVAPAFRMGQESGCGPVARCLAGRLMTEPDYMELVFGDLFADVDRRVDALMKRALPDLPEDVRIWRKFMATGAMVFVLREQELIPKLSAGLCDTGDVEVTIRRLVQFMSAGLRAPVVEIPVEPSAVRERKSI